MGVFSRMGDIINSNINSMLESAEDPQKIARLIISEMEDTLVEVRTAAARAIADKKDVARRLNRFRSAEAEWAEKAELAVGKGREDLARGALQAKSKAASMVEALENELAIINEAIDKAESDMAKLQDKLDEAKAKHKALLIRSSTAKTRLKVRETVADHKIEDALSRYAALERKVDELEAQADAFDLNQGKSLESQFAELEGEESIEKELAALKAKMNKAGAKAKAKAKA
ncbi:Phage shock protein A @ Suppressor of sigma54-dependent transcription, PspA-like [hydrothermal vent metagenome]|uniref:Phage shock protein A @ Suppressor of sigma54-dependent transcription, PspA-like n=1 Tax=hydrothermal vent metagenome TaxID=652676 RepID=A0A3B0SWB9_9ZZZZ